MYICYNVGESKVPIDVDFDSSQNDNVLEFQRIIPH